MLLKLHQHVRTLSSLRSRENRRVIMRMMPPATIKKKKCSSRAAAAVAMAAAALAFFVYYVQLPRYREWRGRVLEERRAIE